MNYRKFAGVLLVGIAIIACAAITNRITPGTATAAPAAPQAVEGDCLLGPPSEARPWNEQGYAFGLGTPLLAPPIANLASCSAERYGEVVRVDQDYAATLTSGNRDERQRDCVESARSYLGISNSALTNSVYRQVPDWQTSLAVRAAYIGPRLDQRQLGQTWGACIAVLPRGGGLTGYLPFDFSLHDSWRRESLVRNALGNCADALGSPLFCGDPHASEVLAFATSLPERRNLAALMTGCEEIAALETGIPNFAAHEQLATRVDLFDDKGTMVVVTTADTIPVDFEPSDATCSISPVDEARFLTATLRGIGAGAIPFS